MFLKWKLANAHCERLVNADMIVLVRPGSQDDRCSVILVDGTELCIGKTFDEVTQDLAKVNEAKYNLLARQRFFVPDIEKKRL